MRTVADIRSILVLMYKHSGTFGCCLSLLTVMVLGAQEAESPLTRLRSLHLPESPGTVPVIYVPSAKERALRYREELQNAKAWFEEQLGIQAPIVLAVLDRDLYAPWWPLPYSNPGSPGIIYFPSRIEVLLGPEPKAKTPGEYIAYHEAGHIFAARLQILSGNSFVNELIANVFKAAYIRAKRPDLQWALEAQPGRFQQTPRYTSLADLDYLYNGVGADNYGWFQYHLSRIGSVLLAGRELSQVMETLKGEFPSAAPKQETLEQIVGHLDEVQRDFGRELGMLAGPTTLPLLRPSTCAEASVDAGSSEPHLIAVRNDTGRPLTLVMPQGVNKTVAARSWIRVEMRSGTSMKLPDGSCIVAGEMPALAVIDKPEQLRNIK